MDRDETDTRLRGHDATRGACATLVCALLLAAAPLGAREPAAAVETTLHAICAAFEAGDVATIERLVDPGFTLIATDAVLSTRADEIASLTDRRVDYDVFDNHDMTTRLYGDVAVVVGITTVAGRWDGAVFARDLRFTDTLVRRNGVWILVASHATPIPAS